jgi:hypothetical protein
MGWSWVSYIKVMPGGLGMGTPAAGPGSVIELGADQINWFAHFDALSGIGTM